MKTKNMKILDKLVKVENSFTVNRYDNGYLFTVGGKNENDDWRTAHIVCDSMDSLMSLISEYSKMPLHE